MPSSDSSDSELLTAWLRQRNEPAFRALVERYAGLVRMAAWRTAGDDILAAEAAQLTFITLARKASSLASMPSLGGWLHQTARHHALNLRRKAGREEAKRRRLGESMALQPDAQGVWGSELATVIDEALAMLSRRDREALLLRFYRALSVSEVAGVLEIEAGAARKRIERATARLRDKLVRLGVTSGGSLSAVMLGGFLGDVQAAAPMVRALAHEALAGGATGAAVGALPPAVLKVAPVAVPAVVALVGGLWLGGQFRVIAGLESGNARLERSLDAAEAGAVARRPVAMRTPLDQRPVDWEEVARLLRENQGGSSRLLRATARLESQLDEMDFSETLAALDEIAAASLTAKDRELLERHFGEKMLQGKDGYRRAMDRFIGKSEGSWQWTLSGWFQRWFESEPEAALEWWRRRGAGVASPEQIVSAMVIPRLGTEPDTVREILRVLPESKRLGSLRTLSMGALRSPSKHLGWAKMVRAEIPAVDREDAIAWPTFNWSDGDGKRMSLDEVAAYLERIEASPSEREACVLAAARALNEHGTFLGMPVVETAADKVEVFREWAMVRAPDAVDRATGECLASLGRFGGEGLEEAIRLASQFHRERPSDELLIPLLDQPSGDQSRPLLRPLVELVEDPGLRTRFQEMHR